jgi:hypothetical protein
MATQPSSLSDSLFGRLRQIFTSVFHALGQSSDVQSIRKLVFAVGGKI